MKWRVKWHCLGYTWMGHASLLPGLLRVTHHHVSSGCKHCVYAGDVLISCSGHEPHSDSCLRSRHCAMTAHVTVFLKVMKAQHEEFVSISKWRRIRMLQYSLSMTFCLCTMKAEYACLSKGIQGAAHSGLLCSVMLMDCTCTPKQLGMQD